MVFSLEGAVAYNTTAMGELHARGGGITCDADGDRKIADAQKLADVGTVFAIGSARCSRLGRDSTSWRRAIACA